MMDAMHRVVNATRDAVLAESSGKATDPISRGVGLLRRSELPRGEGLIIQPCNSVHSFFMRFPIDVVFVDKEGIVCHLVRTMGPWRASKIVRRARFVVELPAGTVDETSTQVGDQIAVVPA